MSAYLEYMDSAVNLLAQEAARLKEEGRGDEANLARIRLNIHEICRTVYLVFQKTHHADALKKIYLDRLDQLPVNWNRSLQLARAHGDYEKAMIEEVKIAALLQIRKRYLELE